MQISAELQFEFRKAKAAMENAQNICIISHRRPDGDAVGSNLALKKALQTLGKSVTSACVDPVPYNSEFLKQADEYVQDFNYEDFDLIISVDCGALKLVKFHEEKPEIISGEKPFINFDHHESNEHFGTINPVDKHACATCFIMYNFFEFCGWKITIDMATDLLHGIYFDTGGMMHSNATADVFKMVGRLTSKGANLKKISKELFHTTEVNKLRLWGRILERAYVNEDNVTVSAVNQADYSACDATPDDTGGVIDFLNSVPTSEYCVLLSEGKNGLVKGSLRTNKENVNLSKIASKWGGGGHPKASGFGVVGQLKAKTIWEVQPAEGETQAQDLRF